MGVEYFRLYDGDALVRLVDGYDQQVFHVGRGWTDIEFDPAVDVHPVTREEADGELMQAAATIVASPPFVAGCNQYHRLFGAWPEAARFGPAFFPGFVRDVHPAALAVLANLMRMEVRGSEERVHLSGRAGDLRYGEVDTELADWNGAALVDWLYQEGRVRGIRFD